MASSSTNTMNATTVSRGFFSELKKKGSAMSIFSGLSSSTSVAVEGGVDPFEKSQDYPRKLESTSSSSSARYEVNNYY